MKPIGRIVSCCAAAFVFSAAFVVSASAQDKTIELKISHWLPPSHPMQKAMEDWAASVEKASGGTIKSKVFPAQQMGKAFDHYDMARDGIADLTYINPGYQPGRFPLVSIGELPFIISNGKGGSQALDSWYRKYADKEMKDVKFCVAFFHDPGSLHTKKKVVVPADLKGMKIRPAHATFAALVTQLGGTNVQAGAPEVRDVLEKGVADGVAFPWGSLVLFGIDKVVKYHIDAPLYATTFVWVMNKTKYEMMSAAQKKVIDDHCSTAWVPNVAGPWADFEHGGVEKVRAQSDHELTALTPEQVSEWRKAAEFLEKKWADNVTKAGVDATAAMNDFRAELKKYNAAY